MHYKEIEFKFNAINIELKHFVQLVEEMKPTKHLIVSSYDDYFVDNHNNFIRYRHNNESQELTIKRKTCDYNNNERVEINLKIIPQEFGKIEMFTNLLGYKHDFRIYKVCNIYWIENVVLCYYIVYDENMIELNRFIEIEANEEMEFDSENEAMSTIKTYEDKLKSIGINPKRRLKRSLFEMYKTHNFT